MLGPRRALGLGLVLAALVGAGCGAPDPALPPGPTPRLGTTPLRRLSNVEYLRSMRDLFPGVTPTDLPSLPPDTIIDGFENDARSLGPTDVGVGRYEAIAYAYTSLATADDAALANVLTCTSWVTEDEQSACGRALVESFGRRAYRRPLDPSDIETLTNRFDIFRRSIDFRAAVQLTLMALVQSPSFLYRLEVPTLDPTDITSPSVVRVDAFALATRLSYLLWQSGPDGELLDLAANGALLDPSVYEFEVDRMLADPRVVDTIVDFDRQWLDFDRILAGINDTRDATQYPSWGPEWQASEREEVERFVRWSASEGDGTLGEIFSSSHAFVDARMATVYGVAAPTDGGWHEIDLPASERAGVLTRAAFLASRSHPGGISPPIRGVFVLERVLCQPHQSSPPSADLSMPVPMPGEGPVTNRVLFERRTMSSACIGCHQRINGIGFAFENYDAIGAFHTLDAGQTINPSGHLYGIDPPGPFADAIALSQRLATSTTIADCATDQWLRFALGRSIEGPDVGLRADVRGVIGAGGTMREVLRAIAMSSDIQLEQAVQE